MTNQRIELPNEVEAFDSKRYIERQKELIMERVNKFDKLYIEFGGKLLNDMHAARVLPGYNPNVKLELLKSIANDTDAIIPIYSKDIINGKIHTGTGVKYTEFVVQIIDILRDLGVNISGVLITRMDEVNIDECESIKDFMDMLKTIDVQVYTHNMTKGYPHDVTTIVSPEGYGRNQYIETTRPIVIVTAPGANSGKLATCLSQLYHHHQRGVKAGYAKFETFPVWDLDISDPVNIAYEAATLDIDDKNKIDPFHLKAYGEMVVNYNRDIETFPILKCILERITGQDCIYKSPTDMGVNCISYGIVDKERIDNAACKEVARRHHGTLLDYIDNGCSLDMLQRAEILVQKVIIK